MPKMGIKNAIAKREAVHGRDPARAKPQRAGLADALFSATQQRVLGLLFGQAQRSFFATELIGLIGAGSGAVQRELQRLADSGLATVTRLGNQKHYQANPDSPVFAELRSLIQKTVGLVDPLRAALTPFRDRIAMALVYGSVAKNSAHAGSDIDVLIVTDELALEDVYAVLASAEKLLSRVIHPTLYTRAEFNRRRKQGNAFLTKVLAGQRILLFGSEDDVTG